MPRIIPFTPHIIKDPYLYAVAKSGDAPAIAVIAAVAVRRAVRGEPGAEPATGIADALQVALGRLPGDRSPERGRYWHAHIVAEAIAADASLLAERHPDEANEWQRARHLARQLAAHCHRVGYSGRTVELASA